MRAYRNLPIKLKLGLLVLAAVGTTSLLSFGGFIAYEVHSLTERNTADLTSVADVMRYRPTVLASIGTLRTRLVVFDTSVVDLTEHLADPVEVLFATQLGEVLGKETILLVVLGCTRGKASQHGLVGYPR